MKLMNSNVRQGLRSAIASVAIFAMVASGCSQKEATQREDRDGADGFENQREAWPQGRRHFDRTGAIHFGG